MPTTPQVNFKFKNENVQISTPLLGVSHVAARTTKGKFNDPSEVISSYPQFQKLFGEEIVPDGSVSNIEKALAMGSKLRVSRVAGGTASYGYANTPGDSSSVKVFQLVLASVADPTKTVTLSFKLRTKEQGSKFEGKYDTIYLKFHHDSNGPSTKIILDQATANTFKTDEILDSRVFLAWNSTSGTIDYLALLDFINMAPNVDIEIDGTFNSMTLDIYGVIAWMADHVDYIPKGSEEDTVVYSLSKGSDGGDSTADTWKAAYEALTEYTDAYNLILSHIHQHLPEEYTTVYADIGLKVKKAQEIKLMVELPKPTAGVTISQYVTAIGTLVKAVGQSQFICYYGGGIKYYDNLGVIRDCDVLGTVLGLANTSEATFGPWYSYAGQNRGIVPEALGPVMPNLGTPSQIENLQLFANWYMNLFVIKDTQSAGKRTMLWHNFTSNPINNSEKFISIVNLNLYLKKNIRPILEGKLEEPNTFSTWKDIYYQVKPILDDLVNRNAMLEPVWNGDQNAQSYADLQVNTEEELRAGKYHAILSYKDIVTMQEVNLDIVIVASERSVNISVND